jgi:hypothetical protein
LAELRGRTDLYSASSQHRCVHRVIHDAAAQLVSGQPFHLFRNFNLAVWLGLSLRADKKVRLTATKDVGFDRLGFHSNPSIENNLTRNDGVWEDLNPQTLSGYPPDEVSPILAALKPQVVRMGHFLSYGALRRCDA